jgi:calcineurin-like phosphoesterase family protein
MNYFCSDQHLFHKNIIKYCNRPFDSVDHMNEEILRRWNEKITPDDTVYVIGDFALGKQDKATEWLSRANGKKILIIGNHDRSPRTMKEIGFDEVHYHLEVTTSNNERWLLSHFPLPLDLIKSYQRLIHGHHHSGPQSTGKRVNVCVDLWDYMPVTEAQIQALPLQEEKTALETWAKFDIDGNMITIDANIPYDELYGFVQEMKIKLYDEGKK